MTDYIEVEIAVATLPDESWVACGASCTALRDSMQDAVVRVQHEVWDPDPAHVSIVVARVPLPVGRARRIVATRVEEP